MNLLKFAQGIFAILALSLALVVNAKAVPSKIFVLSSGSADSPWSNSVITGIRSALHDSGIAYRFHIDHLDAGRFDEMMQYDLMFRYLRSKFSQSTPDIFITAGPAASHFALKHAELFANSQRILIQPKPTDTQNIDSEIVIDTKLDYSSMVGEALRLSKASNVFIVGDSIKPSDLHRLNSIAAELESQGIAYQALENLDLPSLRRQVANLDSTNMIFYTPIYREHDGNGLAPIHVLKKLHEVANAPIFAISISELGFGSVGGFVHSPTELGFMAGKAAVSTIKNEPVSLTHDAYEIVYDWNEVVRWGYQSKLHPDAEIRFKNPSLLGTYWLEVIVAIVFIMGLLVLLVVLIYYNHRLNRVKNALFDQRQLLESKVKARTQELSLLYRKADKLAHIDDLTEIGNRRSFFDLGDLIHQQTQKNNASYTIVMLDIDWFKRVNDKYGHAVGDCVIKSIATILTSLTREEDVVARIGGEEFAIILSNTSLEQAVVVGESVRSAVEEHTISCNGNSFNTTVSVGVAEYQVNDTTIGMTLARADKALYRAKDTGRNKVSY
jgi:diguanylate cyclase (GGDEF)-like protein